MCNQPVGDHEKHEIGDHEKHRLIRIMRSVNVG